MEVARNGDFTLVMDYFTRVTLEFELDLNARVVEHSTEKLWAVLGQVGGFYTILIVLASLAAT